MNWLRILLCNMDIVELVVLIDVDHEEVLRIKRKSFTGRDIAWRYSYDVVPCYLLPNGSIEGGRCWVIKWEPYQKKVKSKSLSVDVK